MVVKPLKKNSDFVAYIYEIDLSKDLSRELSLKIDELINNYAVLIFPNQIITDKQQVKFTQLFGKIYQYNITDLLNNILDEIIEIYKD